jgi:antiviral helicase SKI2
MPICFHMLTAPCLACCSKFLPRYVSAARLRQLKDRLSYWEGRSSETALALYPELGARLRVLGILGYITNQRTVTLKGRIACELNTCDSLLGAEIISAGILEFLNPPEAAALLSALVCQEKSSKKAVKLTTRLETAKEAVENLLIGLQIAEAKAGVQGDEELGPTLNFSLAGAVYEWARGVPFALVVEAADMQEGAIVRAITRLDELCRDFRSAARVVGDPRLYRQMEAASQCIRRDVVFAASLYIT